MNGSVPPVRPTGQPPITVEPAAELRQLGEALHARTEDVVRRGSFAATMAAKQPPHAQSDSDLLLDPFLADPSHQHPTV